MKRKSYINVTSENCIEEINHSKKTILGKNPLIDQMNFIPPP